MSIAIMGMIIHVLMGFAVGVNVGNWHAEKKYPACVYKEKKAQLKELKEEAKEQQEEMCGE